MRIKELITEAESLPIEERARIIDSLLRSLNPPESGIDKEWATVAHKRLEEVRSGAVSVISGEETFARVRKRLAE